MIEGLGLGLEFEFRARVEDLRLELQGFNSEPNQIEPNVTNQEQCFWNCAGSHFNGVYICRYVYMDMSISRTRSNDFNTAWLLHQGSGCI